MKKTSKPAPKQTAAPGKAKPAVALPPMDERPLRVAIAGAVILLFGIFYWTRQLFEAYNFNDFGESPNRLLYYYKERPVNGVTFPKTLNMLRPATGAMYPRRKIRFVK